MENLDEKKCERDSERLLELYSMDVLQTEPDAVLDEFCEKVAKLFYVSEGNILYICVKNL